MSSSNFLLEFYYIQGQKEIFRGIKPLTVGANVCNLGLSPMLENSHENKCEQSKK